MRIRYNGVVPEWPPRIAVKIRALPAQVKVGVGTRGVRRRDVVSRCSERGAGGEILKN